MSNGVGVVDPWGWCPVCGDELRSCPVAVREYPWLAAVGAYDVPSECVDPM